MTKVLYIPTGQFVTFLKSSHSASLIDRDRYTIIWEESRANIKYPSITHYLCRCIEAASGTYRVAFTERNGVSAPVDLSEFEIMYD